MGGALKKRIDTKKGEQALKKIPEIGIKYHARLNHFFCMLWRADSHDKTEGFVKDNHYFIY